MRALNFRESTENKLNLLLKEDPKQCDASRANRRISVACDANKAVLLIGIMISIIYSYGLDFIKSVPFAMFALIGGRPLTSLHLTLVNASVRFLAKPVIFSCDGSTVARYQKTCTSWSCPFSGQLRTRSYCQWCGL